MKTAALTTKERHSLEHTTGWRSKQPLFRNHFVAGEGHDDWPTLQELCKRGLMRVSREAGIRCLLLLRRG